MSSTTDATTRDEKRAALLASIRLLVFPILSGFALAFSYPPQGFRFLAWVALVPLGLALRDRRNWPELYVGLYLGGLAFHLIHLDWIRSGTGATWLSGPRATQWLAQGTLLALAWPLALCAGRLFIHRSRLPTTLALPLVWTAFEYARRYYWAIFDATGYPYGQLALTQAHHAWLIQIADITGAHGVTAVIAAVNGLAIDCIHWVAAPGRLPNRQLRASAVGVATMLIVVWSYGAWRLSQQAPRVGPIVCLMPSRARLRASRSARSGKSLGSTQQARSFASRPRITSARRFFSGAKAPTRGPSNCQMNGVRSARTAMQSPTGQRRPKVSPNSNGSPTNPAPRSSWAATGRRAMEEVSTRRP